MLNAGEDYGHNASLTLATMLAALTMGKRLSAFFDTVNLMPGNFVVSMSWYFPGSPTVSTNTCKIMIKIVRTYNVAIHVTT